MPLHTSPFLFYQLGGLTRTGMGVGVASFYECELCVTKMFHSTDNYDFGWQV